jgi:hypothetical protein
MLTRSCGQAVRSMLTCARELFLIVAVGILGSQLLIAFNGGAPVGTEAQATTRLVERNIVLLTSFDLELDPGNPTLLRSVYVQVTFPGGGVPDHLTVSPTPASPESYPCHIDLNDSWHCPTPGLRVRDLEQIVVSGT